MTIGTKEFSLTEIETSHLTMSYEEFLVWAGEDTRAEWAPINAIGEGEVIVHMPAKPIHQITLGFLLKLLGLFVDLFDLGQIHTAPLEMKAKPGGPSREPDLLFIAKENLARLTEDRLAGPADLIIEIISRDSISRDRDDKFNEYRDAGVREYWIIDPRPGKHRADFYHLAETGNYRLFATEDDEQIASHVLSGFWLKPAWLWQAKTLNPLTCILEIEGVATAITRQIQQVQGSSTAETPS